ncbi:MAG: chloride channel protein [Candidatus Sulfobium sp.]
MKPQQRLILDTVLLGIIGALGARLFAFLLKETETLLLGRLAGYTPPGLTAGAAGNQIVGGHGLWLIPLVTTLGGLLSGLLVYSLAPEAEGHGTDTAVKSFHYASGFIRARVAPLKMVASAITIGSGGAAGQEGPTALISAGFGSVYATLGKRTDEERRLLVLMGMAAGLSAIFRSPIGTAIFAVEFLYSDMEFDAGALFYTMIASVVAYAVNGLLVGWEPLFRVPADIGADFVDYFRYGAMGIAAGIVAVLLPMVFYGLRDAFHSIPIPPHFKPALGGLGIGLIALVLPQVLGGGYGWIQQAIDGHLAGVVLLSLIFAKMVAFAFTVSSGGSGGVFAPSLFVGAMLGGLAAHLFHQPAAGFVVVGMAAVFGGAARVPLATILMVTEMTGGYHLLGAAALTVMLSYMIQKALSESLKYRTLYEAQVAGRADSPAHHVEQLECAVHLLGTSRVNMPSTCTHLDLRALIASGIPVDLPDGKRLVMGMLRPKSPYVGMKVHEVFPLEKREELEVVAVFRQGHTLLPHTGLVFQSDDRVMAVTTPSAWKRLADHFSPYRFDAPQAGGAG